MRRLRDFQIVLLQMAETRVTCCSIATGGDEVVLEPHRERDLARRELPQRCELIFEADHHPVMLFGMVDHGPIPGTLRFWVTDDVRMRAMRLRPRLIGLFDALVTPLGDQGLPSGPPIVRVTRDVGAGGVFLLDHVAPAGALVDVRMGVPGLPRPLDAVGRVMRAGDAGSAVRFERVDPGLQHVLEQLIFSMRRRIARRTLDGHGGLRVDAA